MKKILHIIVGLDVGGAELMLKRLVESHLDNDSFQHQIISLTDIGKVGLQLQALGVEVRAINMRSALGFFRVLWKLVSIIRETRPDIVQTWMYHADLLGGLAARIAGNRNVIWGIRATEVRTGGTRATVLVRRACASLSHWVPRTIVCAAAASLRAHLSVGYNEARMVVLPNGFDVSHLSATKDQRAILRNVCGFGPQDVVVGTVGRFNPVKDHENFVRAAGLLAQQNLHVRFLMVGRGLDRSNPELAQWMSGTGYADRFVLLGERADVSVCLAAMDIFCLSSRTEGFPNVVGEAMAMGVPCVVTDVGDAAMLVSDTGLVVPKEDSPMLADALSRLLSLTPVAHQQLGQKARARIYAEFTIERARDRFEALYKHILEKGVH